jgi:hypothetical protein
MRITPVCIMVNMKVPLVASACTRLPMSMLRWVIFSFEDEGAGTIAPSDAERRKLWSDEPPAVIGYPEQGGKAGSRVETGPAQPID